MSPTLQAILSLPIVDIAMIIAYLWIWAGFAMVVIGAGLAALNREVLEAAQIDGASEWQTLRRVTVPMLRPVLVVVFVTMLINVLKIFDIILNMAAPSSQGGAATLAVDIYNDFSSADGPGTRRRSRGGAVHPRHSRHAVQPQEDSRMSVQAASLPVAAPAHKQPASVVRPSRIVDQRRPRGDRDLLARPVGRASRSSRCGPTAPSSNPAGGRCSQHLRS